MSKNNEQFREFLRDEVNLNQTRLGRLETSVVAVNGYLKDHLTGYQKTEQHGSHALGTLIKPVDENDEYDADNQIVMNPNSKWGARDYINEVEKTLKQNKNYADKLRSKTRCVTVDYAGDLHLDLVPRVTIKSKHYICNQRDNKFEVTDGTGYREWFNERNRITGGNLKRVVRLLKFLRDHKNNYTAKSILLTTMAGKTIRDADEGTEAVSTVADTIVTVMSRMDDYLQKHPTMPPITNPALPTEDFNRHWDQTKYANFRSRVHSHAATAKKAKAEQSSEKAIEIWQELFGNKFGKSSTDGRGNGDGDGSGGNTPPRRPSDNPGGATAAAGSVTLAPRPREARRFG